MWNISCNGGNFGRRGTRSCFFSIDWIEIYARWNWIETIRIPDQNAINHQPLGSDELAFLISTWIDLILRSNGFVLHRFCTEKTGFISSENFLNFPPRLYRVEFFFSLEIELFYFFFVTTITIYDKYMQVISYQCRKDLYFIFLRSYAFNPASKQERYIVSSVLINSVLCIFSVRSSKKYIFVCLYNIEF